MPTTLKSATRTARKGYRCGSCNGPIEVGDKHHVSTNLYEGKIYDWRTCQACESDNIIGEVYFWAGYPDEGVDYEWCWEWAHESAADAPPIGDIANRFLDRCGCTCERCETRVTPPAAPEEKP